jgi:hypothetical protein
MQPHRLAAKSAILLAAAGASLYPATATFGAGSTTGGTVHVFISPSLTGNGGGTIVLTGAIGDYGTAIKANPSGQPARKGPDSLAKLHHGTILLDRAPLTRAIQAGTEHARPDLASCSLHGSTNATLPILSGTGRYAGISGSLRVKFTFAEVAARYTKGTKNGKCNLAAGPVAQWASVVGTGNVTFK